jgi:hypothetical protein
VRDAARERADGLHLLGLAELRLQLAALGDVADDGHTAVGFARRGDVLEEQFDGDLSAVAAAMRWSRA